MPFTKKRKSGEAARQAARVPELLEAATVFKGRLANGPEMKDFPFPHASGEREDRSLQKGLVLRKRCRSQKEPLSMSG